MTKSETLNKKKKQTNPEVKDIIEKVRLAGDGSQ